VRPNSPIVTRRLTFASLGVSATWPVLARCPCHRGRLSSRFKRTILLLRKEHFHIGASYEFVPWQTAAPSTVVVDKGVGHSSIRVYMFPEERRDYSSRAPPWIRVSDASGQLLKVNAEVSLTN